MHYYFSLEMMRANFLDDPSAKPERFKRVQGEIAEEGQGKSWFHNIALPAFRSVAHLWAAQQVEAMLSGDHGALGPRKPSTMGRFLALAGAIEEWGCSYRKPGTSDTLFNPGEICHIPLEIVRQHLDGAVAAFGIAWKIAYEKAADSRKAA